MDEGKVFVKWSPPVVNRVSTEYVIRNKIGEMMVVGVEAPVKVDVHPMVEEGEILESVPCIHGGGGRVKIGVYEWEGKCSDVKNRSVKWCSDERGSMRYMVKWQGVGGWVMWEKKENI